MRLARLLLILLIAGLVGYAVFRNPTQKIASQNLQQPCGPVRFEGKQFTQCIAVPGQHRISTRITGSNGIIYRGFAALEKDIGAENIAFAFNGGMYDAKSRPIGYYVEDGQKLYALNSKAGGGNFYLKPNGVFFGGKDGFWRVLTADDFAAQISQRPEFGTQSGPMLLVNGNLAPPIAPNGTSLKVRNGVGVDAKGRAHFVISDEPVSFGTLARFMKEVAGTSEALYLDGTVSALWNPSDHRMDAGYPLGPLIVVTNLAKAPAP